MFSFFLDLKPSKQMMYSGSNGLADGKLTNRMYFKM